MPFNVEAAKAAGYTDDEINSYLASRRQASMGEFEGPVKAPQDPQMYGTAGGPARSILSGAFMGWGDEAVAGLSAAGLKLTGNPAPIGDLYRGIRGAERQKAAQFAADNPKTDIALKIGGGVASVLTGPGRALAGPGGSYGALALGGARLGGVAGAGYSTADVSNWSDDDGMRTPWGPLASLALDTGQGAAIGGALGVAVPYGAQQATNAFRYAAPRVFGGGFSPYGAAGAAAPSPTIAAGVSQNVMGPTGVAAAQAAHASQTAQAAGRPIGDVQARLLARADDLDMWVPPGARYDDPVLRQLDASLSSNPLTSAPFMEGKRRNAQIVTEMLAKRIGMPDGVRQIAPEALGDAIDVIGQNLDDVAASIGRVTVDAPARQELNRIMTDATKTVVPAKDVAQIIKRLQKGNDFRAGITGRDFQQLRSDIASAGRDAWRNGSSKSGRLYDDLVGVLDDMAERSAGPDIGPRWAEARRQWSFVKMLEKGNTIDEGSGLVNAGLLRNTLKKDSPTYRRGRDIEGGVGDDLFDALRITRMSRDIIGDSGTATRSWWSSLRQDPVGSAMTLAARPVVNSYATGGGPTTGALLTAPGQPALVAQRGVLAAENASKERKRKR